MAIGGEFKLHSDSGLVAMKGRVRGAVLLQLDLFPFPPISLLYIISSSGDCGFVYCNHSRLNQDIVSGGCAANHTRSKNTK